MTVIHDNKLISYTINDVNKEIIFETVFDAKSPAEYTNAIFSNVVAYYFEHHSLWIGTIFYDIVEVSPDIILADNWHRVEEGFKYGWPGNWAETKEKGNSYFKENYIKGYDIQASIGLSGWVLAKNMQLIQNI